tara:strand:+ start:3763 stop:4164 length:402 start_codon:yes stop_codon:yes gene_type:complete
VCEGCRFHEYPYEAQIPVKINETYEVRMFGSDDDVWDVIDLIIEETQEYNKEGRSFNIAGSVSSQLPFFACKNVMLDKKAQKDISRFMYSKEFGVPPYKGSYGEQPKKWIEKSFLLKSLISSAEQKAQKKAIK